MFAFAVFAATVSAASSAATDFICNVRDFGAVGDGLTDDAPAINRVLAVKTRPLVVRIPKGVYLIGETLRVGSRTSVIADRDARLVMSGAWKKREGDFLLTNADPAGGDELIAICGGVWDGNAYDGHNVKPEDIFAKGAWSGATLNFRNVKGLSLAGMELANSVAYNIRMCELDGFSIRDIAFSAVRTGWNQDGLHFNGHCRNGQIENVRAVTKGQTNDDLLAFNADDSLVRCENAGMVCGPIENIRVRNAFAEDCHSAVRLLSVTSSIANVHIENIRAGCRNYAVNADAARYCRTPLFEDSDRPEGVGAVSNVTIHGFEFYATSVAQWDFSGEPLFCIETNADGLKFSGLVRNANKDQSPTRPFMRVRKMAAAEISFDGRRVEVPRGSCIVESATSRTLEIGRMGCSKAKTTNEDNNAASGMKEARK